MIEWINRYSDTDDPDKQNRWARIAYYHEKEQVLDSYKYRLGWVNMINYNGITKYELSLYFPVSNHHNGYIKMFDSYKECQEELEKLFKEFIYTCKI